MKDTEAVRHLHFEEAAELAYFGAKILHPTCIQPARYANIPVRLLNKQENAITRRKQFRYSEVSSDA